MFSLAWDQSGRRLVLSFRLGFAEIRDLESNPPCPLVRLYSTPGSGFAATPDGYVSGPPDALEYVRFGDGWALYDLTGVLNVLVYRILRSDYAPDMPSISWPMDSSC